MSELKAAPKKVAMLDLATIRETLIYIRDDLANHSDLQRAAAGVEIALKAIAERERNIRLVPDIRSSRAALPNSAPKSTTPTNPVRFFPWRRTTPK